MSELIGFSLRHSEVVQFRVILEQSSGHFRCISLAVAGIALLVNLGLNFTDFTFQIILAFIQVFYVGPTKTPILNRTLLPETSLGSIICNACEDK